MRSFAFVPRLLSLPAMLCLIIAVSCTGAAQPRAPIPQLHIGVDLPLSGSEGAAAMTALNGIRFYVQQHPTLDGFEVSLATADDAAAGANGAPSPEKGAENVRRFIADSNLVAMLGPFDSSVARAEIPVANAAGLAMVSPATSSACLTRDVYLPVLLNPVRTPVSCQEAGLPAASSLRPTHLNNYFRLSTTDTLQGPAAADFAFKNLQLLRVAVISDHEAYGESLAAGFTARLQRLGGVVTGTFTLNVKTPDPTDFLKQSKAEGAQAVYFGGTTADHACEVRAEMASIFPEGEATPFLSGDGIAGDPACVTAAGGNSAGIYATVPIVDATDRAAAQPVIAAFRHDFGSTDAYGPYTLLSYDATAVLYAALDRAISAGGGRLPGRADVASQLASTQGFQGTTGTLGFDPAGDTTNRILSVLEPAGGDLNTAWKVVGEIDYTSGLPY